MDLCEKLSTAIFINNISLNAGTFIKNRSVLNLDTSSETRTEQRDDIPINWSSIKVKTVRTTESSNRGCYYFLPDKTANNGAS